MTVNGTYEVGTDIASGVYTAEAVDGCVGFTASDAGYQLKEMAPNDAYLAGASRVGDRQRILVRRGEFFTSMNCGRWQLESGAQQVSPDPATLAGACQILVGGDDLTQEVVAFGRATSPDDSQIRFELQEKLSAVVYAGNKQLGSPAGQLVDFLDDPSAYVDGGQLDTVITAAIAKIRKACRDS